MATIEGGNSYETLRRKFDQIFRGFLTVTMAISMQLSVSELNMSFKSLVSAVTEQYHEIKEALALLSYFENWEPDLITECCRISSIAEFPPESIILGPATGDSHTVYFILDGICKIVKNLYVEIKTDFRQQKLYRLCNFSKAKMLKKVSNNDQYYSRLFSQTQDFQAEGKFQSVTPETENFDIKNEFPTDEDNEKEEKSEVSDSQPQESENKSESVTLADMNNGNQSGNGTEGEQKTQTEEEAIYSPDHHRRILQECRKKYEETIQFCKKDTVTEKPENSESIFMQIGFLFRGACFGLDKSIKETFISVTRVKCLKVPQRFLLHHNPCNIWNRIRLFYSRHFPKDEEIFKNFQTDHEWIEGKKRQTEEIVYLKNLFNYTLINDVPYSIRLTDKR